MAAETGAAATFRYWAFISYSHADEKWAAWLHRALETYRIPKDLVGVESQKVAVPARLFPVFRDRDELPGAASLSAQLRDALEQSRALIVICSPSAARSRWVNEEVKTFKSLGRAAAVFPVIVGGEPNASDLPGRDTDECFPEAVRHRVGPDGALLADREEPLAADLRTNGDDRHAALVKLAAGILGLPLDALRKRDEQRRKRRNQILAAAAVSIIAGLSVAVWYTNNLRLRAEEQTRQALSGRLAAESRLKLSTDISLSLLLAAESFNARETVQSKGALVSALRAHRMLRAHLGSLRTAAGRESAVMSLAFSPDGRLLAAGGWDGAIMLWDVERHALLGPLVGHTEPVRALAFRRDGRLLASGGWDNTVRLWDVGSRSPVGEPLRGHEGDLESVEFTADGTGLISGASDPHLLLWDLGSRTSRSLLPDADLAHTVAALAPDGRTLVANTLSYQLAFWDSNALAAKPATVNLEGAQDILNSGFAFSPDGTLLAMGGKGNTAVFWSLEERRFEGETLVGHSQAIESLAFSHDGEVLATASEDGTVRLWNVASVETVFAPPLTAHEGWVRSVAFSPVARILASGGADGRIFLWNIDAPPPLATALPRKPIDGVQALAFSPDGRHLAVAEKKAIALWDTMARTEVARVDPAHANEIDDLAYTPDGQTLISVDGFGKEIALWRADRPSPTPLQRRVLDETPRKVAITRDGRHIVTLGGDSTLFAHLLPGLNRTATFALARPGNINGIRTLPAQDLVLADGMDGRIHVLDPATLTTRVQPIAAHKDMLIDVAAAPDGSTIASVGRGALDTIQLFHADGTPDLPPLIGDPEERGYNRLAFSADSKTLVAAGSSLFEIWDLASRTMLGESLPGHPRAVTTIAFHPSMPLAATGGYGPEIYVWDLDAEHWQQRACAMANRSLSCEDWRRYMGDQPYRPACAPRTEAPRCE